MEEMPYYLPGKTGWKKHAEGLIPVIILILIVIVVVGATTNVLCGLPVLGDIFCPGGIIRIAVLGDLTGTDVDTQTDLLANNLNNWFAEKGASWNTYVETWSAQDLRGYPTETLRTLFSNYDIVILAGERMFTREISDSLGAYMEGGGNIVIIGDAGVQDPEDLLTTGWGGKLEEKVPVRLSATAGLNTTEVNDSVVHIIDLNHPIVRAYGMKMDLSTVDTSKEGCATLKVLDVAPKGPTIGWIKGTLPDGKTKNVPGIVEGGTGFFGGKIFYIAYDPGCSPNMWISLMGYVTGKIKL